MPLALDSVPAGASTPEAELDVSAHMRRCTSTDIRLEDLYSVDGEDEPEDPTRSEVWPDPVDGSKLVADIQKRLRAHVIMQSEHYMACALWILHAHCHEAAMHSPILMITAPTNECGKTTLLECLEYMVPRPMPTGDTTPAAIFNAIQRSKPTLLIDEADTFAFLNKQLRGVLNLGHKRGGVVTRKDAEYSVWAPKAMALNDHDQLHATLQGRSIIIGLKRKSPDEEVSGVKPARDRYDPQDPFNAIRMKCIRWHKDNFDKLQDADPELPAELGDRNKDNWRPLIAIADLCKWPERARKAAVAITQQKLQEPTIQEQLLRDIKRLFERLDSPLPSKDIVQELLRIDDGPWTRVNGKPLNVTSLSHLLKRFNIRPREERLPGKRTQCYRVEQFVDAFARYGPSPQKPTKAPAPSAPSAQAGRHIEGKAQNTPSATTEESLTRVPTVHARGSGHVTPTSPQFGFACCQAIASAFARASKMPVMYCPLVDSGARYTARPPKHHSLQSRANLIADFYVHVQLHFQTVCKVAPCFVLHGDYGDAYQRCSRFE